MECVNKRNWSGYNRKEARTDAGKMPAISLKMYSFTDFGGGVESFGMLESSRIKVSNI